MVVIERSSSLSSSASASSSRKEKQSKSCEKDGYELIKGKLVRKTSSSSSPSTPSKKGKQSVSRLKDNSDHHENLEGKLTRKASSGSITSSPSTPSKKGKRSGSCLKENHEEILNGKLTRKASLLSSPSSPSTRKGKQSVSSQKDGMNELHKEKLVRKASLLSSSSRSPTKKDQRGLSNGTEKIRKSNSLIKSRIKELGPICNKRKEFLNSVKLDEDIDVYLDKQIDEGGKINPNDCMWLSSGSMSPQEFGLFMSALDPGLDEWVMSFLPKSSRTPKADGSKLTTPVFGANLSGETEEAGVVCEVNESSHARTQSTDSSSSLDMSTHADSSTFWNMDRTGVWVSLINLDGEDSEFISNVNSKLDDLESNFPSPSFEVNWDSYSSDIGVSSSGKSTQESGSQSEWSSDLLSDSMDWEVDSDDPIYWPYGVDCDWDQKDLGSFTISPRKGVYKIRFKSGEDGCETPDSIRFRLHGRNGKKILFLSGLSASKIIEFKKGCRKNAAAAAAGSPRGKRFSKTSKRASRFRKRVPPILENDLEGISPKDTPKESVKKGNDSSEMDLSECADIWGDELDSNSPLFWPTDQKSDWNDTWDSFDVSPRKSTDSSTSLRPGSPKNGFAVSSSIRLKFLPKKMKIKSGLNSSKSPKFKSVFQKTNSAVSGKRLRVVVPRKGRSMFKSNKNYKSFKHGSHGNKKRDLPPKGGKSVKEFIRLVSILGLNKMFPGNEATSEELPIETLLGLNEFDGHEGFNMEFEDGEFSLMECEGG